MPHHFTIGVEEEFLLLDADSRAPLPDAARILPRAEQELGDQIHPELQLSQLETSTRVCETLDELRDELIRLRRGLAAVAERAGAVIGSAGTHPFADCSLESRITPKEAYLRLARDYQQLAREQLVCGCHVHVGIADEEEAIQVLNRVRPWLSVVLALAANSPFWMGADTGYASYRTEIWRRWPTAGTPEVFDSRADFDRLVETLEMTRSIDAPARLYWDIRPSAKFATLEFRIADACLTVDESVMVAGLVRGLVGTASAQIAAGEPPPRPRSELLQAATWTAARHGVDGDLLDVLGERAAPAREVVASLLAAIRPALERTGDLERINGLVNGVLENGTGAARQRRAFFTTGDMSAVMDLIVSETVPG